MYSNGSGRWGKLVLDLDAIRTIPQALSGLTAISVHRAWPLVLLTGLVVAEAKGAATVVRVVAAEGGFQLNRDGRPYFIKGGGGNGSLEALAEAGGNSLRTWGADAKVGAILDKAQRLGLTVTVGIWLGHERHGFNYHDVNQVARQYDEARQAILRYKDHPALLMWGIGNEMEGNDGENAAIWSAVNNLATLARKLDPNHPTMTVIAEVGGARVKNLHRLCPDIDVVGINTYAGGGSIAARYKQAGGTKPFVLTEFGPPGQWESARTSWGAAVEMTSTEKARFYRDVYTKAIAPGGLCLGSYAFTWGFKQEATATWFGLFLADESRTGGIDALTELWSGKRPADFCPTIEPLALDGPPEREPDATARVSLRAADPEGEPLRVRWLLTREAEYGAGGDTEAAPTSFPDAIIKGDVHGAEIRLPRDGGGYRLYAMVHDDHHNAATASLPLFVKGPAKPPSTGKPAALPMIVYDEAGREKAPYAPSGYMGNTQAMKVREDWPDDPHGGKTCLRIDFQARDGWGGVVWQNPANDWGNAPGGYNLTGATHLTFWARGARGGETVGFSFGTLGRDKKYFDTATGKLDKVTLTTVWQRFTIDLAGKDLSRIKSGFVWSLAASGQPVTFFVDDVRYD